MQLITVASDNRYEITFGELIPCGTQFFASLLTTSVYGGGKEAASKEV